MRRALTYATTIASLVTSTKNSDDEMLLEKVKALKMAWSLLEIYSKDGFMETILDVIMEKKAKMILDATSIDDIREIANPPKIRFGGNRWIASKNSVPEEEMILWSKALEHGPLSEEGFKRYFELFEQFYGKRIDEI